MRRQSGHGSGVPRHGVPSRGRGSGFALRPHQPLDRPTFRQGRLATMQPSRGIGFGRIANQERQSVESFLGGLVFLFCSVLVGPWASGGFRHHGGCA